MNFAMALTGTCEYASAIDHFRNANVLAEKGGDHELVADCHISLARVFNDTSDYESALRSAKCALDVVTHLDSHMFGTQTRLAACYGCIGNVYNSVGQMQAGLQFHRRALSACRKCGDKRGECLALINVGYSCSYLGDLEEAERAFEEGMDVARQIGDKHSEGTALGDLSSVYGHREDFERAVALADASIALLRESGDAHAEGTTWSTKGSIYVKMEDYRNAIDSFAAALQLAEQCGHREGIAKRNVNLGSAYLQSGHKVVAAQYFRKAIILLKELYGSNHDWVKMVEANLSKC
ncbi:MAG: tetratricopeptide repeat protein [Phycisphaerae bacterium]